MKEVLDNIKKIHIPLPCLIAAGAVILATAVMLLLLPGRPAVQRPEPTENPAPSLAQNPYGPDDFQYQGEYLACTAGESWLGIDVSHHQSEIDWHQVAASDVQFAMIRVGYRGIETAELYMDDRAIQNLQGALSAGLKVGAYFFSQAITPEEAVEEAEYVLQILKDYHITMPVVFDWEYVREDVRTAQVGQDLLTEITAAFCARIQQAGYTPMFYFNLSQGRDMLYLDRLAEYDFWLAMYRERMDYPYRLKMWQYTCEGTVPGIKGAVDINLYFPE